MEMFLFGCCSVAERVTIRLKRTKALLAVFGYRKMFGVVRQLGGMSAARERLPGYLATWLPGWLDSGH